MIAAAGGVVLDTIRLDRSGHVDTKFTIPAEIAARNPGLVLTVAYEPGAGGCTPRTVPMNFQVDPTSTASVKPGGAVAMGGFAALPQAFIPTFQVAMDGTDPDELLHAATIAGLIQQMSPRGTAAHPGQPGPGRRQQHRCAHHCRRTGRQAAQPRPADRCDRQSREHRCAG